MDSFSFLIDIHDEQQIEKSDLSVLNDTRLHQISCTEKQALAVLLRIL
jgi:hypothetical protein